ncbi:o-succinylbenzoate--CoA ligase [Pseudanabaena minima]|uniref:o-succinylbenzoate--CoA ligase n=1 Tax=Pseudanabaena minima TaxID=890415 RepID=UPI003DA9284E
MKFSNWLSQRAVQKKDAIALIFKSGINRESAHWTYSQLEADVNQWIDYLQALGIKAGDRIGLLLANHPRYIMLVHALVKCEAIAIFLNIRLTPEEIRWQIADSQVKYLICDEFTQLTANSLEGQIEDLVIENCSYLQTPPRGREEERVLFPSPSRRGVRSEVLINLENIQGIFYTSGTTGKPKGVPLTYSNHFHSAIASALHLGIEPDDNWLLCMPMFHVGGLAIAWRSVINGTAITLLPKFDEQQVLEAIAVEKVTLISLVPTMLNRLLQHPKWQNLLRLQAILLGGAPASLELIDLCLQLNLPIMPTYGMTETASQITTLLPHEIAIKRGSSGLPLFGNCLRIVDDSNQDLDAGEIGQILVQGASVMSGYLHQHTFNAIQDGWLHTGDLGYLDRDGYLFVVSRRSDLIISGGENIYPTEIEAILLAHPAIVEACVVGIGDREWGEIVVAVIVAKAQLSLAEIRDFCEQKSLARYKLPKSIYIWKSLPKTASGKLLRQEIRDRLEPK